MWPFGILRRRREAKIQRILDLLEQHPVLTGTEIGVATGLSTYALGIILKRMEKYHGVAGKYIESDPALHWVHRRKFRIGWIKGAAPYEARERDQKW